MSEYFQITHTLDEINDKLDHLQKLTNTREKPFLSLNEASDYLGLSKQTIYHYTSSGQIPFHKLNDRRLYFDLNDLDHLILNKKNRYKSNSEIEAEATSKVIADRGKSNKSKPIINKSSPQRR